MSENIELHSLKKSESDYEEYQEINQAPVNASLIENPIKVVNDFDFFTKCNTKKYKPKKRTKTKTKTVMDIINSELASTPILQENIITLNNRSEKRPSYLTTGFNQIVKLRAYGLGESEKGWDHNNSKIASLSPIFLRVLEGTVHKYTAINTDYVEPAMFSDIVSEYSNKDSTNNPKFLDIIIENLKFNIHYKFSLEKLLCIRLKNLYEEYETIRKTISEYRKAIIVNRKTSDDVKSKLLLISTNKKDDIKFDNTVLKYTKNMLDMKEKYFQAFEDKKVITHQLMTLWEDIKVVREKKGTTTAYVLVVTQKELEQAEFENQYTQVFEEEFTDMLIKIEYDFIERYIQYKEAKRNVDKNEKMKIMKPKLQFNEDELKEHVDALVSRIVNKNNIDLTLRKDDKLFKKLRENNKLRSNYSYVLKIFIDDVFVCETETFVCNDINEIFFSEAFCIQIFPNNSILKLAMFENMYEVSVFSIAISDIKKNTSESNFSSINFFYTGSIEPTTNYIGSGYSIKEIASASKVRLKTSNIFTGNIITNCEIKTKIGWNDKLRSNQNETLKNMFDLRFQLNGLINGIQKPSKQFLLELINKIYDKDVNEDPNLTNVINRVCNDKIKTNLNWDIGENAQDLVRFKLLHLRNRGKLVNIENQAISLHGNQISTDQINYLKAEDEDINISHIQENDEINAIDLQRYFGMKFVIKLNFNLLTKVNEFLLKKSFKDVVNDYQFLSLRSFFTNQQNLNLLTTHSVTKQQLLKDSLNEKHAIRVTVLKAHNLYDKTMNLLNDDDQIYENIAGVKVRPLRPFVKVSYHSENAQTPTAVGCYPTWNHTININTKLQPLSSIHINVYDECRINISDFDEQMSNTVRYRKHNIWLGAVHVPLRTVLDSGMLRGTFKINTPPFLFGYENLASSEGESLDPEVNKLIRKDTSLITLIITTDISHLSGQTYNLPVDDAPADSVIKYLNTFVTSYLNDFPTRNLSLAFIDTSGANKCVMEFLQPLLPPSLEHFPKDPKKAESALSKSSGLSKSSSSHSSRKNIRDDRESTISGLDNWRTEEKHVKSIDFVLRYVSLIPTYEITESHIVTLMGVELLKLLYGSPLDHTILLASFFIYLEVKCYVIVGFGLPRGLSSYVLVKDQKGKQIKRNFWDKNDGSIWYVYDAVAGEKYELREAGCPLKTVSFVFDCENIWVNVQSSTECENLSFDFTKSADWQVVFNKPVFLTRPVINEGLYIKSHDIESLRDGLEVKIKNKVQKWRSRVKTIWNRYCSNLLRETLPHWEYWAFKPLQRPSPGHRLKQMMLSYKMFGCPLNMPYLNTKLITSSLKYIGLHANDDPTVEFGLAVEVYTYPNNVLSVWVYLASLLKIQD